MSLVSHAEDELDLVDYAPAARDSICNIVAHYENLVELGAQPQALIDTLTRLFRGQPLSQLSSDPREWLQISGKPEWQSIRRATTFSRDGGKTWYDTDDPSLNNGDVWDREAANWTAVMIGNNVRVGSIVRCPLDAYKAGSAQRVNGVAGRVAAIRNGTLAVVHDNGLSYNHDAEKLEVLRP